MGNWILAANNSTVPPVAPPAENVQTTSGVATYNDDRWGANVVVSFGPSRANIAYCEIIVRGPTNFGQSIDRMTGSFIPPVTGDYVGTVGGEWLRAGGPRNFNIVIISYNRDHNPTDNPIVSPSFTVTPVNSTSLATNCTATVWYGVTTDGNNIYGLDLSYTQPNDPDTSHVEVFIQSYDVGTATFNKEQLYNQSAPGGSDNGYTLAGRCSALGDTPPATINMKVIFYTINTMLDRKPNPTTVTVTILNQAGVLKLNRADVTTIGDGIGLSAGLLRVADNGIISTKIADNAVVTNKIAIDAVTTAKIKDLAIIAAKLGNSSVTATAIANAAIGTAAIQTAAITTALINDLAVNTAKIASGSINDLQVGTISASKLTAGTMNVGAGALTVQAGTVSTKVDASGITTPTVYVISASGSQGWAIVSGPSSSITMNGGAVGRIDVGNGNYQVNGSQVINSSSQWVGKEVNTPSYYHNASQYLLNGANCINSSNVFVGAGGVYTPGSVAGSVLKINLTDVINSSFQFIGSGGVNTTGNITCGTLNSGLHTASGLSTTGGISCGGGIQAAGFNPSASQFGQTGSIAVVVDVQLVSGVLSKKTQTISYKGGVIWDISVVSNWT